MSESRTIRTRLADLDSQYDRILPVKRLGVAKCVGKIINGGHFVAAANRYVLFNPVDLGGIEGEGINGTFGINASQACAGVVLGATPAVSDVLTFTSISGRWVAYKKSHNGGGGGPGCPVTIRLTDGCSAGGVPVPGATVTITGSVTASGTTDSDGIFVTPPLNTPVSLVVSFGGCSFASMISGADCPEIDLCYCEATTTVTINGPTDATLTVSGNGYNTGPVSDGDDTPIGVCSVSGSTYTFDFCSIQQCSVPAQLCLPFNGPTFFQAQAVGWANACDNLPILCGSDNSVGLTLFDWTSCYVDYFNHAAIPGEDQASCCLPPCVNPATGAGYYPKSIDIRWTSIPNTAGGFDIAPCNLFADDDGSWVTLNLISDTIFFTGATHIRTLHWSSGCRGPEGNFVSRPSGVLNVAQPYECIDHFGSTSIDIITVCGFRNDTTNISYNRFISGDCTPSVSGCLGCDGLALLSCDVTSTPSATLGFFFSGSGLTCSPVDHILEFTPTHQCAYTIDLRETPC